MKKEKTLVEFWEETLKLVEDLRILSDKLRLGRINELVVIKRDIEKLKSEYKSNQQSK